MIYVSMSSAILLYQCNFSLFLHIILSLTIKRDTYKRSIGNVESRRIAASHNTQKNMHRNKVNDKGVPSPRANLEEISQTSITMANIYKKLNRISMQALPCKNKLWHLKWHRRGIRYSVSAKT